MAVNCKVVKIKQVNAKKQKVWMGLINQIPGKKKFLVATTTPNQANRLVRITFNTNKATLKLQMKVAKTKP
jgi:hypothetical protein